MANNFKNNKNEVKISFNELGKIPPNCIDIEEIILGQLLIDSDSIKHVAKLRPEMFYKEAHKKIFEAIFELNKIGFGIDMMTVIDKLRNMECLEICGGAFFITGLTQKISSSAHIIYHSHILHQKYLARLFIQKSFELQSKAFESDIDIVDLKTCLDSFKLEIDNEVNSTSNNLYEETIIRFDEYIDPASTFLSIKLQDRIVDLMSENAMSMIYGLRGARKSTLMALIVGYIASGKKDSSFIAQQRKIKIFDTEQSKKYSQKTLHRTLGVSGIEFNEYITYHTLKKYNKQIKRNIVEMCIAKDKPSIVIIDNIRHFVSNINDFKESGETLEWLLYIQAKYNVHIYCVIHQNKGDNKARGHLGAELDTDTEMTLRLSKDPDNEMQSIITFEKNTRWLGARR